MPQDLLALLDGIYRVHLGQVVHRDFSTVVGLFNLALPATFMSLNLGIVSSLNYSEAVYVVVAFAIYLYIYLTRANLDRGSFWVYGYPSRYLQE